VRVTSDQQGRQGAGTPAAPASEGGLAAIDCERCDERLGEHLVASGRLQAADLARAVRVQQGQPAREALDVILVKLGLVSERDVAAAFSRLFALPLVERNAFPDSPPEGAPVSARFLRQRRALILGEEEDRVLVAMGNPCDRELLEAVGYASGKRVVPRVALPSEIEAAIEQIYGTGAAPAAAEAVAGADRAFDDDVERLKEIASEAPVIKLANQVIVRAVDVGASDIHIEPFEKRMIVRYRVDGMLREAEVAPVESAAALVSRVKILASLNIAERRLPQDGRFKARVHGKEIDLRVSTVPTLYGESVVLRLLRRSDVALEFGSLGFDPELEAAMLELLGRPHGILLVTGPTGSGKTTTLYAALQHLNTPERKILTVEDPVEYNLDGINQIHVKPQIGLTFANALRSIVRQDPDVIMIGEMRDGETARIAVQSALTGHLVLSTLHTNDAPGSVTRLLDMGVEDYLVTSTVNGILAQRLVRKLCPHCRAPYLALAEVVSRWRLDRYAGRPDVTLYRAAGCERCAGTGYAGRTAIVELLRMTDPIRELVLGHADAGKLATAAVAHGMRTMLQDGLRKAVQGATTVEEVLRVTQE
jgi:general secretion pathway protein E